MGRAKQVQTLTGFFILALFLSLGAWPLAQAQAQSSVIMEIQPGSVPQNSTVTISIGRPSSIPVPSSTNLVSTTTTVDLDRDDNHDGIPDALVEEMNRIKAVVEKVDATSAEKDLVAQKVADQAVEAAIGNMYGRLPYSAKTRELQNQVGVLSENLNQTKDVTESLQIIDEIKALESQMMADSNYVKAVGGLRKIVSTIPEEPANQLTHQVFLPMVTTSAKGSSAYSYPAIAATDLISDKTAKGKLAAITRGLAFSSLDRGDIMLINSASSSGVSWLNFVYALDYSHAGSYDGNNNIYSSNTSGVKFESLKNDWQKKGSYVALGYDNRTTYQQDKTALDWAKNTWKTNGTTKYNYNLADKYTNDKLYCSQLVWKIQKYNNVDVDSNNWQYLAYVAAKWGGYLGATGAVGAFGVVYYGVAPDEIARSSNVFIYSKGWN